MGSIKDRLLSRKFLVAVATFLVALINAILGTELIADEVIASFATAAGLLAPMFWVMVEGWADKNGAAGAVQANVAQYQVALRDAQVQLANANKTAEAALGAIRAGAQIAAETEGIEYSPNGEFHPFGQGPDEDV